MARARRERVALVHDFLLDLRGAERVFLAMCDIWPDADVFTAVYDEDGTEGRFAAPQRPRDVPPAAAPDVEHVPRAAAVLPGGDRVARPVGLRPDRVELERLGAGRHLPVPGAVHVCYSHNPFRYAWNDRDRTLAERRDPVTPRRCCARLFRRWRQWDWIAAQRVDHYVANSRITQGRIRSYFGRESTIVHPPVETARFTPGPRRRLLPRAVRADAAQADRHGRRRRSTGCGCRS